MSVSGTAEYAAPRNECEEKMVGIWQEVLGAEQVGIHDQFFDLGGHSLKAMTMLAKIHKAFGVEVPLQVLFEKPTVAALSGFVSEAEKDGFAVIEPAPESDDYPLSLALAESISSASWRVSATICRPRRCLKALLTLGALKALFKN